jgi:UDP-glucuronate 4-epimerase
VRKILVTGTAGFIGFHLSRHLLDLGLEVTGVDVINDYYDTNIKKARLAQLGIVPEANTLVDSSTHAFRFIQADLTGTVMHDLMKVESYDAVVHLAAQAGVRYSLTEPMAYIDANITATLQVLEACRHHPPQHLVYASSSSVYGLNTNIPHSTQYGTNHPISLYAATKKSNELMAHAYSHLFDVPTTGLRFFTAYGPWGRPDMALFLFTKAIIEGQPIDLYNHGQMLRDFTYIDDIVKGITAVMYKPAKPWEGFDPGNAPLPDRSSAPFRVLNIGISNPTELIDYVREIEKNLGKEAKINYLPMQPGDVAASFANVHELETEYGYKPKVLVQEGVKNFIDWYLWYYNIQL